VSTYFDTSFLVALYVPNDHSAAALRHRRRHGRESIPFTPLHRLELRTVVRQCVCSRLITEVVCRDILRHIEQDLDDGTLVHEPLDWTSSLRRADAIAGRRAMKMPCRSLDLWHVAAGLEIKAARFVTFDTDQFELARAEGLRAVIPR
jgi:predicted nucleic acid-binding protein